MHDEFTYVIAKAVLVVVSSTGIVLSLAWIAAWNSHLDLPDFIRRRQTHSAGACSVPPMAERQAHQKASPPTNAHAQP